jgi:ribonuclease Z
VGAADGYLWSVDLSLFFVGTSGSVPSARRGLPALLVCRGGERLLFDCGEGTQRQLLRSVGLMDLDAIFVTHFHADHWLGLPGMLKSFQLRDRDRPLTVYGPLGLEELMDSMRIIYGRRLGFELDLVEVQQWEEVECSGYRVAAVPVNHGARTAQAYALVEDDRPGEFDPGEAERLGVPPGPAFGELQRGHTVAGVSPEQVMGPPRKGRKIIISGDTAPCETLAVASHAADVLVHEATFGEDEATRARETFHSTAAQAAELAVDAGVKLLALTHVSSRYAGGELLEQARAIFPATEAARDFDTIEVPFPERAAPRLERWSERRAREQADGQAQRSAAAPHAGERGEQGEPAEGAPAPTGGIAAP